MLVRKTLAMAVRQVEEHSTEIVRSAVSWFDVPYRFSDVVGGGRRSDSARRHWLTLSGVSLGLERQLATHVRHSPLRRVTVPHRVVRLLGRSLARKRSPCDCFAISMT